MKRGFTLIEIIAVLMLVSVLVLASTIALLPVAEGLVQARQNVDAAQKAQQALMRMTREIITITNVVSSGEQSIVYDFIDPVGTPERRTLAWSGGNAPVTLNGVPLTDDVSLFQLRYYNADGGGGASSWGPNSRIVEVVLGTASGGEVYTNRIRPRNIPGEG
jgi:prepilin-type N-terminal cleavage/methylation domain-containing protein